MLDAFGDFVEDLGGPILNCYVDFEAGALMFAAVVGAKHCIGTSSKSRGDLQEAVV